MKGGQSTDITRSNSVTVPNKVEGKITGVTKGDSVAVTVSDNAGMTSPQL